MEQLQSLYFYAIEPSINVANYITAPFRSAFQLDKHKHYCQKTNIMWFIAKDNFVLTCH